MLLERTKASPVASRPRSRAPRPTARTASRSSRATRAAGRRSRSSRDEVDALPQPRRGGPASPSPPTPPTSSTRSRGPRHPEEELGGARRRARPLRAARHPRAHLPPGEPRRRGRGHPARGRGDDPGARGRCPARRGCSSRRRPARARASAGGSSRSPAIREAVPARLRRRVGVCVDTCHVHAAGYDLATDEGYERDRSTELDRSVGLSNVARLPPQRLEEAARLPGRPPRAHRRGRRWGSRRSAASSTTRASRRSPRFVETELRFKENIEVLRGLVRR